MAVALASPRDRAASARGDEWLRYPEMAADLSISVRTFRRLVCRGYVPLIRLSRRLIVFDPDDVKVALKKRYGKGSG